MKNAPNFGLGYEVADYRTTMPSDIESEEVSSSISALQAVVAETEASAHAILDAVEEIANACDQLAERSDEQGRDLIHMINHHTLTILEQCGVQDITGQRISRVTKTLHGVDDRMSRMLEILGAIPTIDPTAAQYAKHRPNGDRMDGPALPGAGSSQGDIDALLKKGA